jgi:hypothetical protein
MQAARWAIIAGVALLAGIGVCAASAQTKVEGVTWQSHHVEFDYFGLVSRYTCDGIGGKVGQILRFFGARADLEVRASGCPRGGDSISRSIWVRADFSTLSAAKNATASSPEIEANWTALKVTADRPSFMGRGDCELVDQMRKVLSNGFTWRDQVSITTSCQPYSVAISTYTIQGEVLRADPAPRG